MSCGAFGAAALKSKHFVVTKYAAVGAGRETRTLTLLPEPDFESGASTSSATPAWEI